MTDPQGLQLIANNWRVHRLHYGVVQLLHNRGGRALREKERRPAIGLRRRKALFDHGRQIGQNGGAAQPIRAAAHDKSPLASARLYEPAEVLGGAQNDIVVRPAT
jgi:hypothetical protein